VTNAAAPIDFTLSPSINPSTLSSICRSSRDARRYIHDNFQSILGGVQILIVDSDDDTNLVGSPIPDRKLYFTSTLDTLLVHMLTGMRVVMGSSTSAYSYSYIIWFTGMIDPM